MPNDFLPTAFIDTLSTKDDHDREIPGAKARIQAMREMRFRPDLMYAQKNSETAAQKTDEASPFYTYNGVRFLKPMENPQKLNFDNFKDSRVKVIENRGFFHSLFRGISMFVQSLTVLGGIRLWGKTKQILPGNFGYAMNFDGDIEIYPESPDRRIGISPYTNITVTPITSPYVNIFNRIHLVNVPEGKYALAMKDRHPIFLPAGRHMIESFDFVLNTKNDDKTTPIFYDKNSPVIQQGDSYIIRVPQGKVIAGDLGGKTVILEPEYSDFAEEKAYVFHEPTFKLAKRVLGTNPSNIEPDFQDTGSELVTLGPVKVLTVVQTHAGVTENNGTLEIYTTGRHALVSAQHVYKGQKFDLTQQKLAVNPTNEIFTSADNVQLSVKADLLFKVVDVEKCMKNVGVTDYKENIRARTMHILRELIKSSNYLNSPEFHLREHQEEDLKQDFTQAQTQLLSKLGASLRERLQKQLNQESGIELHDVLITNLLPHAQKLRDDIESNASQISQKQREITQAQMEKVVGQTKAEIALIEKTGAARADAAKITIDAEAQNTAKLKNAEAEAQSRIMLAEANKTADKLQAEGLKYYDGVTPGTLGYGQAMTKATADATRGLLQGANVNLIGQDAQSVGAMMMSSFAGTLFTGKAVPRPVANLEGDVLHPRQPIVVNNQ